MHRHRKLRYRRGGGTSYVSGGAADPRHRSGGMPGAAARRSGPRQVAIAIGPQPRILRAARECGSDLFYTYFRHPSFAPWQNRVCMRQGCTCGTYIRSLRCSSLHYIHEYFFLRSRIRHQPVGGHPSGTHPHARCRTSGDIPGNALRHDVVLLFTLTLT